MSVVKLMHVDRFVDCFFFQAEDGIRDTSVTGVQTCAALGAGLLVAEIQQASDTTYRLYDWGRSGPDGKARSLHVEEALAVIDYAAVEIQPQRPQKTTNPVVECLVHCDKFVLNRWTLSSNEP